VTIQEVKLYWSKRWSFGDLYRNPDFFRYTQGLYAFLSHSPLALLYIGMTYDQSFSREVANHLGPTDRGVPVVSRADSVGRWIYKNRTTNLKVKIAHIELASGSRISRELVADVEAALINIYQPPANLRSKRTYYGRAIRIKHKGSRKPFQAVDVFE
jgi:hypothetical protein